MDYSVRVVGADTALKALRVLEPTVAREVGQDITKIGQSLAVAMLALVPSGPPFVGSDRPPGWTAQGGGPRGFGWAPVQAVPRRRGTSVIVTATSDPPAIASFAESLGRGTKVKTDAGRKLVKIAKLRWSPIVKSGKKEGRIARAAIASKYPEVIADLDAACQKAVSEVNRRMP